MTATYDIAAIVTPDTAPYHRFLRQGAVKMQRCPTCGYVRYPSRPYCPECLEAGGEWAELPGTGTVDGFVWYWNDAYDARYDAGWAWREVPYNVAMVTLDGGPTFLSNVVGVDADGLKAGQKLQPVFVPISDEFAILRFRVAAGAPVIPAARAGLAPSP